MELSLVISTLGRTTELLKLFETLKLQTVQDFEIIIVDQNQDDRLLSVIDEVKDHFDIHRVHTPDESGASRGRNRGIEIARGRVLLFPDDDCWYPADFLVKGLDLLRTTRSDFVTGRAADETGRTINGRFETEPMYIDRENVWTTGIEWMCFFDRQALLTIRGFDETIGVGAASPWLSCEAQDLVLRLLRHGYKGYFSPELFGHHGELETRMPDQKMRLKGLDYARGFGRVARLHGYSPLMAVYWSTRPFAPAAINIARLNWRSALYYLQVARGRFEGYFRWPASQGNFKSMLGKNQLNTADLHR